MKNPFFGIAFFILAATILFVPSTQACETPLFSDTDISLGKPENISDKVLRQRQAELKMTTGDLLDRERVCLNLFPDVRISAQMENTPNRATGAVVKKGRIAGMEGGHIILAITEKRISAFIHLPYTAYKVRYRPDGYYIIREITPDSDVLPGNGAARSTARDATPLSVEQEVMVLVNQERSEAGLHTLSWNSQLFEAARDHSADMAALNYFSHVSQDGRKFSDRIAAKGYDYNSIAENIAAGQDTPQQVMEAWMASDGHRANILRESICDIGVGYAYDAQSDFKQYWTQNFGRQMGVASCPASTDPDPPPDDNDTGSSDSGGSGGGGGCFLSTLR